jgi:Uma2 family endonuclease
MTVVHVPFQIDESLAAMYPEPPPAPVSEEDYMRWSESHGYVRAEWIDGEISFMPPVGPVHDDCSWWIGALVRLFVARHKLGRVKFDTWTRFRVPRPELRGPDILFVRSGREHVFTDRNVSEPPDLIIEVVSPGDESRDYRDKYLLYEAAGVREYLIVDPASQSIEAYRLNSNGKYERFYERDGKLASEVVAGWYVRPEWLWGDPQKDVLEALAELEQA